MTLPKTSTFSVFDDDKEVARLITVAKNMGYNTKFRSIRFTKLRLLLGFGGLKMQYICQNCHVTI